MQIVWGRARVHRYAEIRNVLLQKEHGNADDVIQVSNTLTHQDLLFLSHTIEVDYVVLRSQNLPPTICEEIT